ncbi:MAG: BON domain-containing protein [Spirochaetales bacterium]|nr:BON domain-containing protein [Spirochaetales bacterium]
MTEETDLKNRILDYCLDNNMDISRISFEVKDDEIILNGILDDEARKNKMLADINAFSGGRRIEDRITVKRYPEKTNDELLAIHLNNLLHIDPLIDEQKLNIDVLNGCVTIRGKLETGLEKDLMNRLITTNPLVKRFTDSTSVELKQKDQEKVLKRKIHHILADLKYFRSDDIDVSVKGDIIVLSGRTVNWIHRNLAENVIASVCRNREIRNNITIVKRR